MSTQVQIRRGTTVQHSTFTGAAGEITVDTDRKSVVIHDGTTAGGSPVPNWAAANATFRANVASGVVAASYGSATNIPILIIDTFGRVTSAANVAVSGMDYPFANTKLANTSGTVYRGDLYFANGNVGIGIASAAPTELYVNGSAAATINTLVDGATVTPIFGGSSGNNNFTLTLAGNRVIANPVNPIAGQSGTIYIIQDSTGGRTLSWGNTWRFQGNTAPTLSTSANSVDMLVYAVRTTANISAQLITNIG